MEFDVLIRNGKVVDGTGAPAYLADVGIRGDTIAAIGDLSASAAGEDINAQGHIVAPGFIDVHIHSEIQLMDAHNDVRYGSVLQGVTTHLTAPDGFGWSRLTKAQSQELWPAHEFANGPAELSMNWPTPQDYLAEFSGKTPVNVVPQVPHCAVRFGVMGWSTSPANDEQLQEMRTAVADWMEAGARALNLGLDYQPSAFSDTRELVELSKVAASYGGIYAAHIRYNDYGRAKALEETFQIGEQAGIPVHVSHEHVNDETRDIFRDGMERCDFSFESYLYPASCTHLALTLPIWAQAGGPSALATALSDPVARERCVDFLEARLGRNGSRDHAVFLDTPSGRWIGESIQDIADAKGMPVGEFAVQALLEEQPYALMLYFRGTPPDEVAQINRDTIQHPRMMVASDGMYHGASAHPRGFGTFAAVLQRDVRKTAAVSIEDAVRKMSGFPAERFGIRDRGILKEGLAADIVIFDADTVRSNATFADPRDLPEGVDRVLVNGVTVAIGKSPTGALPGKVV